jgi:hypothetical protein
MLGLGLHRRLCEKLSAAKKRKIEPMTQYAKLSLIALALLAALATVQLAQAAPPDEHIWMLNGLEEKKPTQISLSYGVPESDNTMSSFSCKAGSGDVEVWVLETSDKLKAGKKARAVFSVGETKSTVAGALMPNEDAGVPSFKGKMPAIDPLFAAMAQGKELVMTVGPSKQTAPLKGAAEKITKFIAACAKR